MRVSILIDREVWAEFQAELVRQGIQTSDGPTTAIRSWLTEHTLSVAAHARALSKPLNRRHS